MKTQEEKNKIKIQKILSDKHIFGKLNQHNLVNEVIQAISEYSNQENKELQKENKANRLFLKDWEDKFNKLEYNISEIALTIPRKFPELELEFLPKFGNLPEQWMASLKGVYGIMVFGETKEKAFQELMLSIEVYLSQYLKIKP